VRLHATLAEAVQAADALLLVTRWSEFQRLPALLGDMVKPPLLLDGRRVIEPSSVPRYEGIGR